MKSPANYHDPARKEGAKGGKKGNGGKNEEEGNPECIGGNSRGTVKS